MIERRVFYSFHYAEDSWRAATVRNIGVVEGNRPATDNRWEAVKKGGDAAIRKWIDGQMKQRSCALVLVGEHTAGRHWIDYEIKKAWSSGMGLVGIRIHRLLDREGCESARGRNPFERFTVRDRAGYQHSLASVAMCHDPDGFDSKDCYAWIRDNLAYVVEEAIGIRGRYP